MTNRDELVANVASAENGVVAAWTQFVDGETDNKREFMRSQAKLTALAQREVTESRGDIKALRTRLDQAADMASEELRTHLHGITRDEVFADWYPVTKGAGSTYVAIDQSFVTALRREGYQPGSTSPWYFYTEYLHRDYTGHRVSPDAYRPYAAALQDFAAAKAALKSFDERSSRDRISDAWGDD